MQVARDEGHLTATFYFVDQASGIEALFDAVRPFVGVEPVGMIDWHQSATELRDLLRASGDKSAKM